MCSADAQGAVDISASYPGEHKIYVRTTHEGLVLRTYERNGSQDSDFLAVVWNPATNAPETIEYGTTRAWTYPNSASVDATAETKEAYRKFLVAESFKELVIQNRNEAFAVAVGKDCKVVKGRKLPLGTLVRIRRIGEPLKYSKSRFARATVSALVDVLVDGKRDLAKAGVWVNVENLEVLNPEQFISDPESFRAESERYVAVNGRQYYNQKLTNLLARTPYLS